MLVISGSEGIFIINKKNYYLLNLVETGIWGREQSQIGKRELEGQNFINVVDLYIMYMVTTFMEEQASRCSCCSFLTF